MPNEVNLKIRVNDGNNNPREGLVVDLMLPDNEHPFNPQPTVIVTGLTTGSDGYINLTGISAAVYDIRVTVSGNYTFLNNYVVKNSFVTNPDQLPFESRFSVRSGESIAGAGILTHNKATGPTGTLVGEHIRRTQYDTPGPQRYQNSLGTNFTATDTLAGKQSGNYYYHGNQNTTFTQKVDIQVKP